MNIVISRGNQFEKNNRKSYFSLVNVCSIFISFWASCFSWMDCYPTCHL